MAWLTQFLPAPFLGLTNRGPIGIATTFLSALLIVACSTTTGAHGQSTHNPSQVAIFGTIGGGNTQFPFYADNALGFSAGAVFQPNFLFGIEARGGAYPAGAKFVQEPFTAGLHIGPQHARDIEVLFFGYLGGGASRAQDSASDFKPTPASWSPCWQVSQGADFAFGKFAWRVYEASWTQTYTSQRSLRTVSLSTGIVFYPGR